LVKNTIEFIPNLLVATIVLIAGILIADKLRVIIQSTCESLGIPSAKVISSFVFYFVFITIFVMALSQAKIDTGFLSQNISILLAGVVLAFSIGYGLASKELISNYIASFSTKGKFNIGDNITIGNISGIISEIDKTSVILDTDQGKTLIPINKILNESITITKS
jgi:small-conductance mechanosensitive channel